LATFSPFTKSSSPSAVIWFKSSLYYNGTWRRYVGGGVDIGADAMSVQWSAVVSIGSKTIRPKKHVWIAGNNT
jgi:hypothetical protein